MMTTLTDQEILARWEELATAAMKAKAEVIRLYQVALKVDPKAKFKQRDQDTIEAEAEFERCDQATSAFITASRRHRRVIEDDYAKAYPNGPEVEEVREWGMTEEARQAFIENVVRPAQRRRN